MLLVEGASEGAPQLVLHDKSTNEAGIKGQGNNATLRAKKDADTPVLDGSLLVLPQKVKSENDYPNNVVRSQLMVNEAAGANARVPGSDPSAVSVNLPSTDALATAVIAGNPDHAVVAAKASAAEQQSREQE